jgi:hypothetical protein
MVFPASTMFNHHFPWFFLVLNMVNMVILPENGFVGGKSTNFEWQTWTAG